MNRYFVIIRFTDLLALPSYTLITYSDIAGNTGVMADTELLYTLQELYADKLSYMNLNETCVIRCSRDHPTEHGLLKHVSEQDFNMFIERIRVLKSGEKILENTYDDLKFLAYFYY